MTDSFLQLNKAGFKKLPCNKGSFLILLIYKSPCFFPKGISQEFVCQADMIGGHHYNR